MARMIVRFVYNFLVNLSIRQFNYRFDKAAYYNIPCNLFQYNLRAVFLYIVINHVEIITETGIGIRESDNNIY